MNALARSTAVRSLPCVLRGGNVVVHGTSGPQRLDVAVGADGRIAALGRELAAAAGAVTVELAGSLIVPGLVDAHQHLDKALTRDRIPNPSGTLDGAVAGFRDYAAGLTREALLERARRTLDRCLARGTVAIRTHANVDPQLKSRSVEALVALREECRERARLQVVAFVTSGATKGGADAKGWLDDAIAAGADAVGGAPAIADDPPAFLDLLFAAADRHGLPIDLHLDEHLDAERQLFDAVIERTRAWGLRGRVTVGHCSALSALPPEKARTLVEGFREVGIGVVTLPAANLFLQGRCARVLPPRGLTRVRELVEAGVPVAAASDNIEDPFVPVGSGDLLETARWTLLAAGLRTTDLPTVFAMVTSTAAELIGLGADYGIRLGARADLLITECRDVEDLVACGPARRTVLVSGCAVAGPW
jgi:cytosine deaminase